GRSGGRYDRQISSTFPDLPADHRLKRTALFFSLPPRGGAGFFFVPSPRTGGGDQKAPRTGGGDKKASPQRGGEQERPPHGTEWCAAVARRGQTTEARGRP